MRRFARAAGFAARPSVALAAIVLIAVLGPASVALATTGSTPSPTPSATTAAAATSAARRSALPINLNLLGIKLNLTIPLTLNGLLGLGGGTSTTPPSTTSSTPATSSAPPSSGRPGPPTSSTSSLPPPPGGGFVGGVGGASSHHHGSSTSRPNSATATQSGHNTGPRGSVGFTHRLFGSTDATLLVVVLVATCIGVAVFVQVSGRRGKRAS